VKVPRFESGASFRFVSATTVAIRISRKLGIHGATFRSPFLSSVTAPDELATQMTLSSTAKAIHSMNARSCATSSGRS
jgi:hypothetical protein